MAKRAKSPGNTGAYGGQPTPADLAGATTGVDTAWNEGGAPQGWYPTGESQWTQTAPQAPVSQDLGGGGGGIAALPPTQELASSPEWLAYLNQLGLSRDQFTADIQRQRGVAQSLATQQAGDIAAEGPGARRGITGNLETRGMARSGQLIRSLADQRAAEGRQQAGVQTGLAGTLSGLESSLAQKLIDLDQQRASQELSLRSSGAYT